MKPDINQKYEPIKSSTSQIRKLKLEGSRNLKLHWAEMALILVLSIIGAVTVVTCLGLFIINLIK